MLLIQRFGCFWMNAMSGQPVKIIKKLSAFLTNEQKLGTYIFKVHENFSKSCVFTILFPNLRHS